MSPKTNELHHKRTSMVFTEHHLRRHVVQRATRGTLPIARLRRHLYRPAKVGELDQAIGTNQEVLGLQVAMDDAVAVAVLQCSSYTDGKRSDLNPQQLCCFNTLITGAVY